MNKKISVYADGVPPDVDYIDKIINEHGVCGFTCNPTLIKNYLPTTYYGYCKTIIDNSKNFPVSIQVLANDFDEMIKEAQIISSWANNVYVKIPVVNERDESCLPVIISLLNDRVKINVTAIFEPRTVVSLLHRIPVHADYVLSIFSGRIADTGRLPNDVIRSIRKSMDSLPENRRGRILWAGTRQVLDIYNAEKYCDIITVPKSVLDKINCTKKTLRGYCLETVRMFADDSKNFTL